MWSANFDESALKDQDAWERLLQATFTDERQANRKD
jgi:hypothetical protein